MTFDEWINMTFDEWIDWRISSIENQIKEINDKSDPVFLPIDGLKIMLDTFKKGKDEGF